MASETLEIYNTSFFFFKFNIGNTFSIRFVNTAYLCIKRIKRNNLFGNCFKYLILIVYILIYFDYCTYYNFELRYAHIIIYYFIISIISFLYHSQIYNKIFCTNIKIIGFLYFPYNIL